MNVIERIIGKIKWLQSKRKQRDAFKKEFLKFSLRSKRDFELRFENAVPYLNDNTATTDFDAHYVYHPAWAARIVKTVSPAFHVDISSTLYFCTQLSAFIPVHFYDFRPALLNLDNLKSLKADLTDLFFENDSIECISCMHTVEHIGLGRYGDSLDPDGDLKAINELKRVVKPAGTLLFVVPVGKPKIIFNAHRIYSATEIVKLFNGFKLNSFSLVTDNNEFIQDARIAQGENEKYGCGCFWFIKE